MLQISLNLFFYILSGPVFREALYAASTCKQIVKKKVSSSKNKNSQSQGHEGGGMDKSRSQQQNWDIINSPISSLSYSRNHQFSFRTNTKNTKIWQFFFCLSKKKCWIKTKMIWKFCRWWVGHTFFLKNHSARVLMLNLKIINIFIQHPNQNTIALSNRLNKKTWIVLRNFSQFHHWKYFFMIV